MTRSIGLEQVGAHYAVSSLFADYAEGTTAVLVVDRLDRLLHAFKYGGRLAYAEFFAAAIAQCVRGRPAPDALVALPSSSRANANAASIRRVKSHCASRA